MGSMATIAKERSIMTKEQINALLERLDGYGLVITDYEILSDRIDTEAAPFDWHDCHECNGKCGHMT